MLDEKTKKLIDDLRDTLAGKIPNPQGQVEQITIALIYKFMSDLDKESIEMGGVSSFFVGDYEKYAWDKLFEPTLGGQERVKLYREAVEDMYSNPSAPPLFRDIFKNAILPFNDPEILNMFLKDINKFNYSDSEKLGDAYEYLLSFMSVQGKLGQFRTPRHIIDFIVDIVNPQKNERILDPACGTAGFLISAFKHIEKNQKESGKKLTFAEHKKISNNLIGYDIDPVFTKISLVNMYLHDFKNPNIFEYDTLTSEDKWGEYFDIILANPPFFTPKGGIQPHSRFEVQSNRAEVLFVDYIMDHLNPNGRAGIVVPDGVLFKDYKIYKKLREKLIENFLIGVISLPSGAFNPYSPNKTSILILDKKLSKKSNDIFFAKVENDGFHLGKKRYPIDKNDLPIVIDPIKNKKISHPLVSWVNKSDIRLNPVMNLLGDKYEEREKIISEFPIVPITKTFKVLAPAKKIKTKDFLEKGKIPIIDQSVEFIAGYWNEDDDKIKISDPVVVFGDHTKVVKYIDFDFVAGADGTKILRSEPNILPKFLFYIIKSLKLPNLGYSRHFKELKEKEIPLPPIKIQKKIIKELEVNQKAIIENKKVIEINEEKIRKRIGKLWSKE